MLSEITRVDLNPIKNFWDVLEKTLHSGPTPSSSIQDLVEKCMSVCLYFGRAEYIFCIL